MKTQLDLPNFSALEINKIVPTLDAVLKENSLALDTLMKEQTNPSWDTLMQPLDMLEDKLHKMFSPISHLNSVKNSKELNAAYSACLPKLSDYYSAIGQNKDLFHAIKKLAQQADTQQLNQAQRKILDDHLRDFHLAGVDLPADKQKIYRELQQQLSQLTDKFQQNLLEANKAWTYTVTDEGELAGIPEHARQAAQEKAQEKNQTGWCFTLEFPSYSAIITFADSRTLREKFYFAYATRASDQGPNAGEFDNSTVMVDILKLREQKAKLLGFNHYADYSLATKMVQAPDDVLDFLWRLNTQCHDQAQQEFSELTEFAKERDHLKELQPWDIAYYSEKLQQHRYAISSEELRPYFPLPSVLSGLFNVIQRLYGIEIKPVPNVDTWHPDVKTFALYEKNNLLGMFYVDLYARSDKRGGAWMDDCLSRHKLDAGTLQLPVAYIVTNFAAPTANTPALLTHQDVLTLFHEVGHGLHHLLTQVDYLAASGINGVPWDAVELPSQFFENWCWVPEVLHLISNHYQTNETLPDELIQRLLAAKNFHSALHMARQLEFSLFDFIVHQQAAPTSVQDIQRTLDDVRAKVTVVPAPAFHRFQHSFSHIFSGGYAAGYYSYKWAEVLSADAFSAFEEEGIFNPDTGRRFLNTILAQGGSREPLELFIEFRGREPHIDALLRHSGIGYTEEQR